MRFPDDFTGTDLHGWCLDAGPYGVGIVHLNDAANAAIAYK